MRTSIVLSIFLTASCLVFAQHNDSIRGTRVGGVRPGTVQRSKQTEDPAVRKEIVATSQETGIGREKLLSEFRVTQQKFAEKTNQKKSKAAFSPLAAAYKSTFTAEDFHKAKVFSVKNNVPMDTIIDRTAAVGNLDTALSQFQVLAK